MYKFILIALITFNTLNVHADEYFYFGDEQTMKNKFSEKMLSFFKKPSLYCKRAYLQPNNVLNGSSRYATAARWVSASSGDRVLIKDYLAESYILNTDGQYNPKNSSLKLIVERYGVNPQRRIILAMGNIETFTDKDISTPLPHIADFTSLIEVPRKLCVVIAPHPYVKEKYKATRAKYIKQLEELQKNENTRCQVVFYDEAEYGPLTLKENGLSLTDESYEKWADATIDSICKKTRILVP